MLGNRYQMWQSGVLSGTCQGTNENLGNMLKTYWELEWGEGTYWGLGENTLGTKKNHSS
jgi:hypothetical protein